MLGFTSIALVTIVLSESGTPTEAEYSIESTAFGDTYWSYVFRDKLDNTPIWDAKAKNPPVSARRALKIAEAEVETLRAQAGLKRLVDQVALVPVRDRWIWQVSFVWKAEAGGSSGIPDHFHVLVLMDGSAVKPVADRQER